MSKPKLTNWIYRYIHSAVSNALHLEYAIRAAESLYPKQMNRLNCLREELISYWINKSIALEEIEDLNLIDVSLDRLQFNSLLIRRNDIYEKYNDRLSTDLDKFYDDFIDKYLDVQVNAFKFFRVADLTCGNDIHDLYVEAQRCMKISQSFELSPDDELNFDRELFIREPVHVHPALTFCGSDYFKYEGRFGAFFDLKYSLSREDLFLTMREFMYQYAAWCSVDPLVKGWDSRSLVNSFFDGEFFDSIGKEIRGQNGLYGPIVGLYCYDKHMREGKFVKDAIYETQKIRDSKYTTIEKYYKKTYQEVDVYKVKFESALDY